MMNREEGGAHNVWANHSHFDLNESRKIIESS